MKKRLNDSLVIITVVFVGYVLVRHAEPSVAVKSILAENDYTMLHSTVYTQARVINFLKIHRFLSLLVSTPKSCVSFFCVKKNSHTKSSHTSV